MKDFQFKMPTKIIYGNRSCEKLISICQSFRAQKVFILTGPNIAETKGLKSIQTLFEDSQISYQVYSDIVTDPTIEVVDRTAAVLKESRADLIVAVGGGSTLDTAKAISLLQTNEGSIKAYLFGGSKSVDNRMMPLICLPTTAGSGSEVTAASVITDTKNNIKLSVAHENIIPDVAVIDPNLHLSMPQSITASTGMDALTHAIEAYVSLNSNPMSDINALAAIKGVAHNLRTAVSNGNDLEARGNMAIASCLAAVAFMNGGLGVVHGIAQSMGGVVPISHGLANAMVLPHAMKRNFVGNLEKFKNIAAAMGKHVEGLSLRQAALESVNAVFELSRDIGLPRHLGDVGVTKAHFPQIIKGTMEYRLLAVNPCRLTPHDVETILDQAI